MNTKEFYYWLTGYMSGMNHEESETTYGSVLEIIQEKLKEVNVENDVPFKLDLKEMLPPIPKFPGIGSPPMLPKEPITSDPPPETPYIGDPLPGQEPIITCKNDKSDDS